MKVLSITGQRGVAMKFLRLLVSKWTCFFLAFAAVRVFVFRFVFDSSKLGLPTGLQFEFIPFIASFILAFIINCFIHFMQRRKIRSNTGQFMDFFLYVFLPVGVFTPTVILLWYKLVIFLAWKFNLKEIVLIYGPCMAIAICLLVSWIRQEPNEEGKRQP
jgi:hypothetical protein